MNIPTVQISTLNLLEYCLNLKNLVPFKYTKYLKRGKYMKIRNGFVSNSSSSSFIVIGTKPEKVNHVKLEDKEMIRKIIEYINNNNPEEEKLVWDGIEDVYLTEFLYDGLDDEYDYLETIPKHAAYLSGAMSGHPYGGYEPEEDEEEDDEDKIYYVALKKSDEDDYSKANGVYVHVDHLSKPLEEDKSKKFDEFLLNELANKFLDYQLVNQRDMQNHDIDYEYIIDNSFDLAIRYLKRLSKFRTREC